MKYKPKDRKKFDVLGLRIEKMNVIKLSEHAEDRIERIKLIEGFDSPVDAFIVDTGHKNGLEIHYIMPNASVVMVNRDSGRLITVTQARPNQLKRYYIETGLMWDEEILKCAIYNSKSRRCEI